MICPIAAVGLSWRGAHSARRLAIYTKLLQADGYAGFEALYSLLKGYEWEACATLPAITRRRARCPRAFIGTR
jgi:hypothetical protein